MPKYNKESDGNFADTNSNGETKVIVSFPDKLEMNVVQENELKHYEIFQWLVTVFLPIAVGFWTAYFTLDRRSVALVWSAAIFTAASILFIYFAAHYRRKMSHGSVRKSINLNELR